MAEPIARAGRGMLAASVAAEAMLFPVGAIVFSRVTFAGLGLNFVAIPLMALILVIGIWPAWILEVINKAVVALF